MGMDTVITIVIGLVVLFFFVDGIRQGARASALRDRGAHRGIYRRVLLGHALAERFEGSTRISYAVVRFFFSAVVFVAVALAFHLIGLLFQKIVSVTILGPVDRIGGAVFGAVKGVLFVSLVCVAALQRSGRRRPDGEDQGESCRGGGASRCCPACTTFS